MEAFMVRAGKSATGESYDVPPVFSYLRKRDGRVVPFDVTKITAALAKAGEATGEFDRDFAETLCVRVMAVLAALPHDETLSVEQVQDIVEETLLNSPFKSTAKAYILYRDQHARIREMSVASEMRLIERYLDQLDWRVRENSNMAYSLQGLNNHLSSELSKSYWLNRIYTAEIREAHTSGALHIHDLGQLSVYCVGWDVQDLLLNGFRGVAGKAESRPARHFRSALGQIVNFFYTLQGEAAGAQAFSNFDTYLAPFIRYDGLSFEDVRQSLQEFVFNVNVPTRVGFQTPFTNVTLDLQPPKWLRDQAVIVAGRPQSETYGDFQEEMTMFNTAFLDVLAEGDAKGRVFTFPIPTYNITEDFDYDAPGLSRLWEATAKYGIPYFANFVNSEMSPDDARSMCCRLRLDLRSLERRGGGLFGANPLTGSIGVVTINLPRLGHQAHTRDDFFRRLSRLMDVAKTSLETKRKVLEKFSQEGLYPYAKYYLRHNKERFDRYWHNHFSTIGVVGMNEACVNLFGKPIHSEEGGRFAKDVLDFMRERLVQYQSETGSNYNLEATPAEGTAYRLARLDFARYPDIACLAGHESDTDVFYTNSTQLPHGVTDDPFEALEMQDELQARYTGGTVMHVFLGEAVPDPNAVKTFVRNVCENYHLPYFTVTPTFSICPEHGYTSGEHHECPTCGAKTEVYSRVVGYLRPLDQWNDGKRAEFAGRTRYRVDGAHCSEDQPHFVAGREGAAR